MARRGKQNLWDSDGTNHLYFESIWTGQGTRWSVATANKCLCLLKSRSTSDCPLHSPHQSLVQRILSVVYTQRPQAPSTMDRLPPEMQQEIFSYLWLDEMAHCRLVSHSFKLRAEESMKRITHLDVGRSKLEPAYLWTLYGSDTKEMNESYVKHTFFSKPFVKAQVPSTDYSLVGSRVFAFLAKFCPNLQVLEMGCVHFSCDDVLLLGPNLQYFTCLDFHPGISGRTAASVLHQLPNLKGLEIRFPYGDGQKQYKDSWNRALLQLNRPVCRLGREAASSEETVELLAREGTKCLHFSTYRINLPFSLPQSLAESLVELSVGFEPTVQFCPFPLPNLLYLTVTCEHEDTSHHLGPILSAPRLRCLTYNGSRYGDSTLNHLRSFLHHFDQLRVLSIKMEFRDPSGEKISLPTGLEKLTFEVDNFELLEYSSPSLTHLVVGSVTSFSLACPSLKVLSCRDFILDPESLPGLLHSLSECVTLVQFRLSFFIWKDPVSLQPLIDLLSSMTQLTHLQLCHLIPDAHFHGSVDFEVKKFPSLSVLHLDLRQTQITFHLTSSFIVSTHGQYLELRGPKKNYFLRGYRVEFRPTKN